MSRGLLQPRESGVGELRAGPRPPISCFGSHMEDNMESILYTHAEVGEMTKLGGGVRADISVTSGHEAAR